jgi:hypothetical protein
MTAPFPFEHVVQVRLGSNTPPGDFDSKLQAVVEFREWLDELVEWQPNQYHWVMRRDGSLDVWFVQQEHAIMCSLKWL